AVAWPFEQPSEEQAVIGLFYNHLPTRMSTGLPVDIHGDFQVKEDREGMSLDADNDVGKYNIALLCRAADAHVKALHTEALKTEPRVDFWSLADRPENTHPAWIGVLQERLFPSNKFDFWVKIASNYFEQDRKESAYRDFWYATQRWIEKLVGYGNWTQTWKNSARDLCDILAKQPIRLIPILTTRQRAVALPSRQDKGQRADRRVFSLKNEGEIPPLPDTLVAMGRVVTSFSLGAFENPAGIQSFTAVELLPELRQISNDPHPHQSMKTLSDDEQGSLLRFAYYLTQDRIVSHSHSHFAWRAFAENANQQEIGRALATMYLPTVDEKWEPARQLTEDRVNVMQLSKIMAVENLSDFLRLLGVAPAQSVPLVEGGLTGRMPPVNAPPYPQEPGNRPIAKIAPILDQGSPVQAVIAALKDFPTGDNDKSEVFARIHSDCWLAPDLFETFDGVPSLTDHVAPQDVVLDRRREERIFFAVPKPDTDYKDEAWHQLGIPTWPDDEVLALRVPSILQSLKKRFPLLSSLPASVALSLSRFYNQLIKLLPEGTDPVPVLIEESQGYRWREGV
ncbi:MAG TPA: hypothetical protein P5280_17480, partial [Cyclobacteriaceae bacterium]|nr:hypothetical protein [Cyclobacteriaceae bacterium]